MRLGLMLNDPEEELTASPTTPWRAHSTTDWASATSTSGAMCAPTASWRPPGPRRAGGSGRSGRGRGPARQARQHGDRAARHQGGRAGPPMLAGDNAAGEALVMGAVEALIAQTLDQAGGLHARPRPDRLRRVGQPRQPQGGVPSRHAPPRSRPRPRGARRDFPPWIWATIRIAAVPARWTRPRASGRSGAAELRQARAVRGEPEQGHLAPPARRQRVLAVLHRARLRRRARLQGRQQDLPQALGRAPSSTEASGRLGPLFNSAPARTAT